MDLIPASSSHDENAILIMLFPSKAAQEIHFVDRLFKADLDYFPTIYLNAGGK